MVERFAKIVLGLLLVCTISCSPKWTEAIKCGEVLGDDFTQSVKVEVVSGLIIIPVSIQGRVYRFLFDSGAPTSISFALQKELGFRTISHGHMVDSEHNRDKIEYVRIERLEIADIPFICQTAFVGDFVSNPAVKCLQIDGIIGSNLMRFCNWKIDYQNSEITFSNQPAKDMLHPVVAIPFRTDNQYDILVDIEVGLSKLRRVEIDYGSNGGLILPSKSFEMLKKNEAFNETFSEKGVSQSGMLGVVHDMKREVGYLDSLSVAGKLNFQNIEVKSNGFGLIGSKLLSQYVVVIDWDHEQLLFKHVNGVANEELNFGFHVGEAESGALYVQSVIDASPAYNKGIRPNMKLLKIDALDFVNENNFCDFMRYFSVVEDKIKVELLDEEGRVLSVELEKRKPSM